MNLCPACNGLTAAAPLCPICGIMLGDAGRIEEYLDPYSPYMEAGGTDTCTHFFECPQCGYQSAVTFSHPGRSSPPP